MHTFFTENISSLITLSEIESRHAIKVLRLSNGDKIRLIDGKGTEAIGEIKNAHHKHCEIAIISSSHSKQPTKEIAIALAPTKSNDRTEWFLEKAIEIGITHFIPIICKNSERKKFNTDRWDKIAVSALKQSKRLWAPKIDSPIKLEDFIHNNSYKNCFIAHCEEDNKKELASLANNNQDQLVLIGPEGDFTNEEILIALDKGFTPISLGDNRLRTETAGIVACTLLKYNC